MTLKEKVKMCERMKNYVMYVMSGMKRRIRIGWLIWNGLVVLLMIFRLAAGAGEKEYINKLDKVQRKFM